MLKVLDLFSGIGGISFGLHRAGMETTLFCEKDEFCQNQLFRIYPTIPIVSDVTRLNGFNVKADIICGVIDGLSPELSKLEDKKLKAYGNSVCPEIPYLIGKRIVELSDA